MSCWRLKVNISEFIPTQFNEDQDTSVREQDPPVSTKYVIPAGISITVVFQAEQMSPEILFVHT